MYLKRIVFLVFTLCLTLVAEAQNLSQHNWYFGNSTNAIRFNRGNNKAALVNNKFKPFGRGGSAVATNASNGDLIFYTDGRNIYDATNVLMDVSNPGTSGAGLLADTTSNQPVVICPVPEDSTKYFVFTNDAKYTTGGTIKVSVVDMTVGGNAMIPAPPLGSVINKNMATGLSGRSEGMIIVPHFNGKDYWLITHQNGNTVFTASLITKTSFNPAGTFTFTSSTAASGVGYPMSVANFSYNPKVKKLAVSAQDPNTDAIIIGFDDGSGPTPGAIALDRIINNTGTPTVNPQSIYDIQWDEDGQYLYISRAGEPGISADVLQYDYNNPTNTLVSVLKNPIAQSWGLQQAPDSAIYHIYQTTTTGPFLVEKFTKTDTIASYVVQTPLPFGNINFNGRQFPSFSPKPRILLQLSFTPTSTCQNTNTTFVATVIPNADSLIWNLGDTTSTAWSPVHQYKKDTTYKVKLIAYYQGDTTSFSQMVTIKSFDLKLGLIPDTTACHSEFPPSYGSSSPVQFSVPLHPSGADAGGLTFTWSNGQMGKSLLPAKPGYYYVTTSPTANGCIGHAGVNVKEYELADQRQNIWYFGNNAGIDFNNSPPTPLSGSNMDAPAGCAIVCDRNGQVIFYTDGNQVFDKTKTSIATGIGGDAASSQSSLIVPVPGDETLYYIFTTQAIQLGSKNEVRYSVFDLKLNGGVGGLDPTQTNVLLFSKSTERITASTDWLIAHEWGNNTFRAYRITAGGLGDPVYSSIGSDHSFEITENGQGYMKLGPNNTLAVALSTPGTSNLIELFHLNDSTGVVTYYRKISLSNTTGQVYGVEFSGGGSKVYATVSGTASSDIYEYSIDSVGHTLLKRDSVFAVKLGELQMAPDNRIYIAIDGSTKLGLIYPDDNIKVKSTIDMGTGFALASGTNSWMGLPNFKQLISNPLGSPGFTFSGICLGYPTQFNGSPTDPLIDKYKWNFDDGGGSDSLSVKHTYAAAKTYNVVFQINNRCLVEEGKSPIIITHPVTINLPPGPPSLPPATPICTTPVTLHAGVSGGPLSYQWSTGATTESIIVSQPTSVSVTNTNTVTGCSSTGSGVVVDNRPKLNLGPDQTLCQNTPVPALDAQNAGDTYQWYLNGVMTTTSQFQGVSTSSVGLYTYKVHVSDPVTNCYIDAQKAFTIMKSPAFSFGSTNTACNGSTGTITLSSISSQNLYSYFISGPSPFVSQYASDVPTSTTVIGPITSLAAGTYSAIIIDQISGCTTANSVGVNNTTFTVTPSTLSACDSAKINVITTVAAFPLKYTVTNGSTGQTVSATNINTATFNVQLHPQGQGTAITYTVQVTDANGCIVAPNYLVTTSTTSPLAFTFDPCANPAKLNEVSSATGVQWTGTGIAGVSSGKSINVTTVGTDTYQVKGTDASSGCPIFATKIVDYSGPINPNFTYNGCVDPLVLTATPTNAAYTYRWYVTGSSNAPSPDYLGQVVTVGSPPFSNDVSVEIFDSKNGCTTPRKTNTVNAFGPITATLTSTLACDDGKPFVLTSTTNATSPIYQWSRNNNKIVSAVKDTTQQVAEGLYQVKITQGSCKDSASLLIVKAPLPVGFLKLLYQICSDPDNHVDSTKHAILRPGKGFTSYDWYEYGASGYFSKGIYSDTLVADNPVRYRVDLTNAFGCLNSDYTEVINDCEPIIAGPNAFHPASIHADNKVFQLFTFYITSFELIVFNRWGEAVYESKDEHFKWNGGYNGNAGQPLPGGTYTYVVRYVSSFHPDRGVQELRGGVVLLR